MNGVNGEEHLHLMGTTFYYVNRYMQHWSENPTAKMQRLPPDFAEEAPWNNKQHSKFIRVLSYCYGAGGWIDAEMQHLINKYRSFWIEQVS